MLEHLPNALTALRIAAVPVLAWLAIVRDGDVFVAVLIACLIGDVVDGRLARALNAWLLPEWTADVRGVYWILAQRRETCTEMANSG